MPGWSGHTASSRAAVAVFVTENAPEPPRCLRIGAAFLVIAVLGDRIRERGSAAANLTIRDLARQTFALAEEAEQRGNDEEAARLRTVGTELQALARGYRRLRGSMRASRERTRALERVMAEARSLSQSDALEPAECVTSFDEGTADGADHRPRPDAGQRRLRDLEAVLDAIDDPRSGFERYHGLRLAEMMVSELTPTQRAQLTVVVERRCGATGSAGTTTAARPASACSPH